MWQKGSSTNLINVEIPKDLSFSEFYGENIKKKKLNSIIFFLTSKTKLLRQITTSFEFNVAITGELSKLNINVARGD